MNIGHFVYIYGIDEKERRVIFLDFTHHDEAYK
jgi:mRNA-degrading endonuclease RelE of RelBE toxin-antitoxin system